MHVAAEPRSQVQSLLMAVVITLMVRPRLALSVVLSAASLCRVKLMLINGNSTITAALNSLISTVYVQSLFSAVIFLYRGAK